MTGWIPAIAPGVVFENVGDETLVLVGNPPQVVRLSPEASELLTLIQQNPGKEIKQTPALSQLVDLGVVEDTSPSTLSRRNVLQLSAVAGAVGLSTVLLPQAAMASSDSADVRQGVYQNRDNQTDFQLFKVDFPEEINDDDSDQTEIGDLIIPPQTTAITDKSTIGTRQRWFDRDGNPYAGVVTGELTGRKTGNKYTVEFTEGLV